MPKEKTSKLSVLFMENDNKYKNLKTSMVFGQCVAENDGNAKGSPAYWP